MDSTKLMSSVSKLWDESAIQVLSKFIEIPCKSMPYDSNWKTNAYFDKAEMLFLEWAEKQNIPGLKGEIIRIEGRTPLLYIEIPGTIESKTVMFYGHVDKMPEMDEWDNGLGPWTPVLKDGRLYGRGAVDDGYAALTPIVAIKALCDQNMPYPKCVLVMEASEECGSPDFPAYLEVVRKRAGNPDLIFCLDSGGESYDRLWCTSSLRGIISGVLSVEVLRSGVHSGIASGIVPSTFRIARQLLSRVEDEKTGNILLPDFWIDVPEERRQQIRDLAKLVGNGIYEKMPFVANAKPVSGNPEELILNQLWKPYLEVVGAEGMPQLSQAGSVLRAQTKLKLSFRIPPMTDPNKLALQLKDTIEKDPPYGAKVAFTIETSSPGWNAATLAPSIKNSLEQVSQTYYGHSVIYSGSGGGMGIIELMKNVFPRASIIITGALGPDDNEHAANESLNIPVVKKLTCCVAGVLEDFSKAN